MKKKIQTISIIVTIFFSYFSSSPAIAQVTSSPSPNITRLFEKLADIEPIWESEPKGLSQVDENTRREFYEKRRLKYQKEKAKLNKAIDGLAAMGNIVVDPIISRVKIEKNPKKRTLLGNKAAEVLGKIGTRKAREALADMVFRRNGFEGFRSSSIFETYLRVVRDTRDIQAKLEAREILRLSDNIDFTGRVLNVLPGVPVDTELLEKLNGYLQSTDHYIRFTAGRIIGKDPCETYAREKVTAIAESLKTVEQLPKANERYQNDRLGTLADNTYFELTRNLVGMKGADEALCDITDKLEGKPRMCVVIARAHRGDSSVKDELRNIITDRNMVERTLIRVHAVSAFDKIGTPDDLPFLEKLSESDPVECWRLRGGSICVEMIEGRVINNTGERSVKWTESDPVWKRLLHFYPIRDTAYRAIELIKKKSKDKQINSVPKELKE